MGYHPDVGMKLSSGLVVAGRYRLDRPLGDGGMGAVWAATHTVTRRKLALKFLRGHLVERPDLRKRFIREARAASLVEHPNVVRIHDVFELEDGTPIMVMDLLEGETLRARFDRAGAHSLDETARLLLPVISAVGTAHELGIVHRDLKPENIFVGKDGEVRVLDFGIAKLHADEEATVTAAGAVLGTPCYMAPEQGFGEPDVDHRADVWAIGVILYEALSGGRPVEGENLGQVLKRLMEDGITPLAAVCPDLPEDVAELVMRMLARDRSERSSDLREAREVLSRHSATQASPFGTPGSRPPEAEEETDPAPESAKEVASVQANDTAVPHTLPSKRGTPRWALMTGVAAVLGALAVVLWPRTATSPAPNPPTAAAAPTVSEPAQAEPPPKPSAAPAPRESAELRKGPVPRRAASPARSAPPAASSAAPVATAPPPPAPKPPPSAKSARPGLVEEPPF